MSTNDSSPRGPGRQHSLPVTISAYLVVGGLIALSLSTPGVFGANISLTLYGTAAAGWSLTSGTETNPGPTLRANEGDVVTAHMISEDALPHGLFIDFNDNSVIDPPEDYSSPKGTDETFTFTVPSLPGLHYYYCSIHSASGDPYGGTFYLPGAPMSGRFITNGKPSASFTGPTGGASWTSGTAHTIEFTLSDESPPTSLTLWVNYSYNGGSVTGPIAGPISGTANPNVVSWTPTGFGAADVVIEVTAVDSLGAEGISRSAAFEVDATPPTIVGRSPAPSAVGVVLNTRVRVAWSERMNAIASGTPNAFAVRRVVGGVWVSGATSWSPDGTVMFFTPSAPWDATTAFEALVNATAKDDSDPGNAIAAPVSWQFTTGTTSDTTPPAITDQNASPAIVNSGDTVTVRANVTDDVELVDVNADVQGPSTSVNLTMSLSAATWSAARTYTAAGAYSFTVWAVDLAGNAASRGGSFTVRDGTPPSIATVAAIPTSTTPNGVVNISAQVTDDTGIANVTSHIVGPGVNVNATMTRGSGATWYASRVYATIGNYTFIVWAVDLGGNAASRSGSFSIAQAPPPPAPSGVMAHVQSDGTIQVIWSPVTIGTVTGYNVYRSTSAGGPFTKVSSSPIPATGPFVFVDTTVEPGVTYYYAVTADNGSGNESPLSTAVSATIPGTPPADYTLWIAIAVIAAVVVLAAIAFLRRRKP